MFEFQKEVPLLIKFPNNDFGGIKNNNHVNFFDIVHTINDLLYLRLDIKNYQGCSLHYLMKEGKNAREKYKLNHIIKKN